MTQTPLRLVFDRGDLLTHSQAIDVPSSTSNLHIHLHLGAEAQPQVPVGVEDQRLGQDRGRSGRRLAWPVLLGVAGVAIVVGAYDLGARIGEGHARALATSQAGTAGLNTLAPGVMQQRVAPPSPSELPPNIRQQLAQPPTIIAPPGATAPAGGPDPFGLQH